MQKKVSPNERFIFVRLSYLRQTLSIFYRNIEVINTIIIIIIIATNIGVCGREDLFRVSHLFALSPTPCYAPTFHHAVSPVVIIGIIIDDGAVLIIIIIMTWYHDHDKIPLWGGFLSFDKGGGFPHDTGRG